MCVCVLFAHVYLRNVAEMSSAYRIELLRCACGCVCVCVSVCAHMCTQEMC